MDNLTLDTIPTIRKRLPKEGTVRLQWDRANSRLVVITSAGDELPVAGGSVTTAAILTALGVPSYASLAAANAALAVGMPYYDTTLSKLQITTA